eukprot:COSAG02_NODE_39304_length_418_cov_1.749216_1_plen_82_part_00
MAFLAVAHQGRWLSCLDLVQAHLVQHSALVDVGVALTVSSHVAYAAPCQILAVESHEAHAPHGEQPRGVNASAVAGQHCLI